MPLRALDPALRKTDLKACSAVFYWQDMAMAVQIIKSASVARYGLSGDLFLVLSGKGVKGTPGSRTRSGRSAATEHRTGEDVGEAEPLTPLERPDVAVVGCGGLRP